MKNLIAFLCGALFAVGLSLSGMTNPQKVVGFLDVFGNWDPSLIFVMAGAMGMYAVFQGRIRRSAAPICESQWHIPTRKDITVPLVGGAFLFGIGWGLSGYCPGPALVSLAGLGKSVWIFSASMLGGMILVNRLRPN